jgi:hypothetical protein
MLVSEKKNLTDGQHILVALRSKMGYLLPNRCKNPNRSKKLIYNCCGQGVINDDLRSDATPSHGTDSECPSQPVGQPACRARVTTSVSTDLKNAAILTFQFDGITDNTSDALFV